MKNHTHKPDGTGAAGYGSGTVAPDCRHQVDRPCPTRGAHVTVRCKCGATGVICPQRKSITWRESR